MNESKSQNPDRQDPDDLDGFDEENPNFIEQQFNPDIFNDNLNDFDLQTPEFDSRSMNDDMCYYLKPPSTALLNIKVNKRSYHL